ncbi:hypothetical protein B0H13DRAFT_2365276 [Mycena leptocephala]|nr:hypothetical protein B0H13DRAFT_2365276 [Mycena leptocephala]
MNMEVETEMEGRVNEDEGEGAARAAGDGDRGVLHRLALAHRVDVNGEARLSMEMEMARTLEIEPKPGAGARTSSPPFLALTFVPVLAVIERGWFCFQLRRTALPHAHAGAMDVEAGTCGAQPTSMSRLGVSRPPFFAAYALAFLVRAQLRDAEKRLRTCTRDRMLDMDVRGMGSASPGPGARTFSPRGCGVCAAAAIRACTHQSEERRGGGVAVCVA